jgi:hypothetical protein
MNKLLIAGVLLSAAITTPAAAESVTLRFQGSIPEFNSFFGAGSDFDFTTGQNQFIASMFRASGSKPGAGYDFTLSYDTATAAGPNGHYALNLLSGNAGGLTNFAAWTPSLYFQQAGAYNYMILALEKIEFAGLRQYSYGIYLALGDNDGTIQHGVRPTKIVEDDIDFVTASFEVHGRNQAYRSIVDQASRGVSHILPGGAPVPEPASWALMITGFALAGSVVRRRRLQPIAFG